MAQAALAITVTAGLSAIANPRADRRRFRATGVVSFVLGMVAAHRELLAGLGFDGSRPADGRLYGTASDRGRFADGYDFVADNVLRVHLAVRRIRGVR